MPLTNAEKQKLYRERHLSFSESHEPLCRLQAFVQPYTFNNVTRISRASGLTKREVIEKAINDLAERLDCNHGDL
ncbi:replication regulatory protein RepB [Nitrosomonas nitrosa]|uniref:Protein CopB n=1 Tax=Nitrosomonas nitrosa TaxID=52442 RepID=A0A1I4US01_9PROT|nr:RepB family protein [Nitrosomonas nitrosa]PTQ92153.1 replication regulatory protein RepB [Nitrosomonas nitrosa]SFM91731.1 Replication regulatory protein RepB [Nitrosomonas nitrosa]